MIDEEFYLHQPGYRPPDCRPDEEFELFRLAHGDVEHHEPVRVGRLPAAAQSRLDWPAADVFAHRCFAQKARFHQDHGLGFEGFKMIAAAVSCGDIYVETDRGGGKAIVFVMPLVIPQGRYLYVPCYLETKFGGRGIFARTMLVRKVSRGKFARMACILRRGH